jgi:phosphotransferase system  glucose/maltose/N-acetylglucosamine-specific IIC component
MWCGVVYGDEELLSNVGSLLIGSFGVHITMLGMSGFIRMVLSWIGVCIHEGENYLISTAVVSSVARVPFTFSDIVIFSWIGLKALKDTLSSSCIEACILLVFS